MRGAFSNVLLFGTQLDDVTVVVEDKTLKPIHDELGQIVHIAFGWIPGNTRLEFPIALVVAVWPVEAKTTINQNEGPFPEDGGFRHQLRLDLGSEVLEDPLCIIVHPGTMFGGATT
jgi:hypothetical protein